jgi:hypothetical protein
MQRVPYKMQSMKLIGNISLNFAFFLYLFLYIPQIMHNRHTTNLANLSLLTHFMLYSSYFFDLFFAISHHLPWQYKTVSVVGLSLVLVQHSQLTYFFIAKRALRLVNISVFCIILTLISYYYFFIVWDAELSTDHSLLCSLISRFCGLLYCLPQIIKNWRVKSATAISAKFVYLSIILSLLDTISAWCLDWGWPSKIASPITLTLMFIILIQLNKYTEVT